jgi:hypothetical protein
MGRRTRGPRQYDGRCDNDRGGERHIRDDEKCEVTVGLQHLLGDAGDRAASAGPVVVGVMTRTQFAERSSQSGERGRAGTASPDEEPHRFNRP